jgi:hypothetical protein
VIQLPIVKRAKVSVSIRTDVAQEFQRFVEWAGEYQPEATSDAALEFLVANFFSSSRTDNQAFTEWADALNEPEAADGETTESENEKPARASAASSSSSAPSNTTKEDARARARDLLEKRRSKKSD